MADFWLGQATLRPAGQFLGGRALVRQAGHPTPMEIPDDLARLLKSP